MYTEFHLTLAFVFGIITATLEFGIPDIISYFCIKRGDFSKCEKCKIWTCPHFLYIGKKGSTKE